jgi:hypothetical protein
MNESLYKPVVIDFITVGIFPPHDDITTYRAATPDLVDDQHPGNWLTTFNESPMDALFWLRLRAADVLGCDMKDITLRGLTRPDDRLCKREANRFFGVDGPEL